MNRRQLIEQLLKDKDLSHLTYKDANHFIDQFLDLIKKSIKRGENVTLVGFGTFTRAKKASRLGVNPATGERLRIKARIVPKFRPGKTWKENC